VIDFDWAVPGEPYLVMELLEGCDLARLLDQGRLPPAIVAEMGVQTCRGLAVAHAQNLVHRDLKPANLFLCRRSDSGFQVKILDFGVAKDLQALLSTELTSPGQALGTAHYMPPEQIRGHSSPNGRADLFALGAVLYEALSGRKPRQGQSYHQVLFHALHQSPAPLSGICSDLPTGLGEAIHKAMAFAPEDRFASAEEMERALVPYASCERRITWPSPRGGASAPGVVPTRVTVLSPATPPPASPFAQGLPSGGERRRARWPLLTAFAAGAVLVTALLLLGPWVHRVGPTAPASMTPATSTAPALPSTAAEPVLPLPAPPSANTVARDTPTPAKPASAPQQSPAPSQLQAPARARAVRKAGSPGRARPRTPTAASSAQGPAAVEMPASDPKTPPGQAFDRTNPYK